MREWNKSEMKPNEELMIVHLLFFRDSIGSLA